jgi:hypothetical protein
MANCGKDILLEREGTGQMQRFLEALNPDSVKLNDFSLEEWMQFAYNFAKHVNYFDTNSSETPAGDWTDFFKSKSELETFLVEVEKGENITPHLALFVSFLKLLELTQKRFNKLTKRHLDFYFKEILKIEKLPATSDKVHVIFELAKNCSTAKIAENTLLDGGKDSNGQKLHYKTTDELIANKTKVAQLKSVFNSSLKQRITAAPVANSFDGIGGDFPGNEIQWWPFGNTDKKFPDAKYGFAIASEILELSEGEREVQITIDFKDKLDSVSAGDLTANIEVFCSGEKKWINVPVQSKIKNGDTVIFSSGISSSKKQLTLAFQIPKDEEAVVKYNQEILGESFNTKLPVCRFLFNTNDKNGYNLYASLVEKAISNITVNVNIKGIKNVFLESDLGKLNAEKPFYPFGTQPVKKSNFYINYPELFKKEWTSFDVNIEWKNTPDNFRDLYYAYREKHRYKSSVDAFLAGQGNYELLDNATVAGVNPAVLKMVEGASGGKTVEVFQPNEEDLIVQNDNYFTANIEIKNKEEWERVENNVILFSESGDVYKMDFNVVYKNYEIDKNGPVRLSLNQSFLQELFSRVFTLAISSNETSAIIPNEPYIPFVETVTLNYSAEANINLALEKEKYLANGVSLFHEHPFGQAEEHPYLKSQFEFIDDERNKTVLLPTCKKGGELYIGLENVEPLQQVSLLVQVLEGSENPEADSFNEDEKVEWAVLCDNFWKPLDSDYMISNETDNFLKSGIVKFSVPHEATTANSLLPPGMVWVRVRMDKNFDAVCKTIDVVAQAVLSEFSDKNNELSHLENGLEAKTISKLIQRVSTVKSVSQPFSSFGGKPQESDSAYYRRISERLRHKNRAITLWDYEHLILQQFPEIFKVKCLNHSCAKSSDKELSFLSPGNVLIVVIPDIINKNVFDIYKPRVSKATLNAIQKYVNGLNTLHVNAQVINPDYEEVSVDLKAKFYKGYDESYYTKELKKDITKLLSPWAFGDSVSPEFGVTLHRSVVINYIEKLSYVDYVEDVILIKGEKPSFTNVAPSSPTAILVSAKNHLASMKKKKQ